MDPPRRACQARPRLPPSALPLASASLYLGRWPPPARRSARTLTTDADLAPPPSGPQHPSRPFGPRLALPP